MPAAQLLSVRLRVRMWVLETDTSGLRTFEVAYRSTWSVPVVGGDLASPCRHRSAHCWFEDACMPAFDWDSVPFSLPFRIDRMLIFVSMRALVFIQRRKWTSFRVRLSQPNPALEPTGIAAAVFT